MARKPRTRTMTLERLAQMMGRGFAAVDKRFDRVELRLDLIEQRLIEHDRMFEKITARLAEISGILDHILKKLTDHDDELSIIRDEMRVMKRVLKEKFKIDIDAIRHR